jgi:hypothetical protein
MKSYEIVPLKSLGPIQIGVPRKVVHSLLGGCENSFLKSTYSTHPTDSWHEGSIQVFYCGTEPVVEYIEASRNEGFFVEYLGLSVFDTAALELANRFAQLAPFDPADPEHDYSYIFPRLELSLWRPTREDKFFSTIGLGRRGYFSDAA